MRNSSDLIGIIRMIVQEQLSNIRHEAIEGLAVPGSYRPSDGTVDVMESHTATLSASDGDTPANEPIIHKSVPILTPMVGHQSGPIGNERCILIPVKGAWRVIFDHDEDDSVQAPQGEKWIHLQDKDKNKVAQSFVKVQADAVRLGHTQKATILAPQVILGQDTADDSLGIVRKTDDQQTTNAILQAVQTALNAFAKTVQSGPGVPPPTIGQVTAQASNTSFTK